MTLAANNLRSYETRNKRHETGWRHWHVSPSFLFLERNGIMEFENMLAKSLTKMGHSKLTENGANALDSTLDPVLDLFATIGAVRDWKRSDIIDLFDDAYDADRLLATKILFYARDIRGGLGERRTFRILLNHCAKYHPEAIVNNIQLIDEYGRFDDLYELLSTPLENDMWSLMKAQLKVDICHMQDNQPVSLLAKWIKTPDASSKNTRYIGLITASHLGYKTRDFKRILRKLRKYLKVTEVDMSANKWDEINYPNVPSRAAMIYHKAFWKHDPDRYGQYIEDVKAGKNKINAGTLYPYDLIERYSPRGIIIVGDEFVDDVVEEQWKALPNYVSEDYGNMLVMADVSGSMSGRPMATSVGLAIYFAERNKGAFKDMFITFSDRPRICNIGSDTTLLKKMSQVYEFGKNGYNTNMEAAFNCILDLAVRDNIPQSDMPNALIIISDMEFDEIEGSRYSATNMTFYDEMKERYEVHGYKLPHIIFWNVRGTGTFHTTSDTKGVTMISGQSTTSFKNFLMAIEGSTPVDFMLNVINSERYQMITLAE